MRERKPAITTYVIPRFGAFVNRFTDTIGGSRLAMTKKRRIE